MHPTASVLLLAGCGLVERATLEGSGQAPFNIIRDCSKLDALKQQVVYMGHEPNKLGTRGGAVQTIDSDTWKVMPAHMWVIKVSKFGTLLRLMEWDDPILAPWWHTLPLAYVNYFIQGGSHA